jgi:hypothetical protein
VPLRGRDEGLQGRTPGTARWRLSSLQHTFRCLNRSPSPSPLTRQISLYEGAPAGTSCPPSELYTTALALLAEGWRAQQPQLVRRASRLLDTVASAEGACDVAPARAVCALLLGEPAAAEAAAAAAGGAAPPAEWAARWLESEVLSQWPECARGAGSGEAEGSAGGAADLQRDWHDLPHVKAVIAVGAGRRGAPAACAFLRAVLAPQEALCSRRMREGRARSRMQLTRARPPSSPSAAPQLASVGPGAGLLDFLDAAGAAATQAVAPFTEPGAAGPAARAQAAADQALDAAQRAVGMAPPPEGPDGDAARGARLRGVLGWAAVGAIALTAAASASPAARRRAAAARAEPAPAAAVEARARPARSLGSPVLAAASPAAAAAPGAEARLARAPTPLDVAAAVELLTAWHGARAAALGPAHDASRLAGVMGGDLLVAWQQRTLQTSLRGE